MKMLRPIFSGSLGTLLIVIFMLTSCNKGNQVVSENFIQKRKYRQGFYLNNGHQRSQHVAQLKGPGNQVKEGSTAESPKFDATAPIALPKVAKPNDENITKMKLPVIGNVQFVSNTRNPALMFFENMELIIDGKRHESKIESVNAGGEAEETAKKEGILAFIAGILAWAITIGFFLAVVAAVSGGGVLNILYLLVAILVMAIGPAFALAAMGYGSQSKKDSALGLIGFILGFIYIFLYVLGIVLALFLTLRMR